MVDTSGDKNTPLDRDSGPLNAYRRTGNILNVAVRKILCNLFQQLSLPIYFSFKKIFKIRQVLSLPLQKTVRCY